MFLPPLTGEALWKGRWSVEVFQDHSLWRRW